MLKTYMSVINKWKDNGGKVVHLTMYGSQAHEIVGEVQESGADIWNCCWWWLKFLEKYIKVQIGMFQ